MTDQLLITLLDSLLVTDFNKIDLFFLLSNQTNYFDLDVTVKCLYCESFFIKFIKFLNSNNYYIYVNINCICIYDNIIIFNISYFYAI